MKRYDCLKAAANEFKEELVILNIGSKLKAEWNTLRPSRANFSLTGGMGLACSIGLGCALALPHRKVVIFDGDGALLMNLGSLSTEATTNPPNLVHVVFDNGCYEHCGGGLSATGLGADLCGAARGIGIKNAFTVTTVEDFRKHLLGALKGNELYFIVAKTETGAADVPLDSYDGLEDKYRFVRYIEETEHIPVLSKLPMGRLPGS